MIFKIGFPRCMIHPHTRLLFINDEIGYGVFASELIPKGTITYVKDTLELEVTPEEFEKHTNELQEIIEKYSYIDERGIRIVSWDFGKYVNHCCHCNTISTGFGFEIALRDIQPGEEITDEYGLFNIEKPLAVMCRYSDCRGSVVGYDVERYYIVWDEWVREALRHFSSVPQPLAAFLNEETLRSACEVEQFPDKFNSVYSLRYSPVPNDNGQLKVR